MKGELPANPLVYDEEMSLRDFEVLEHPADIGFRAFGITLPELFANSAMAMLSIAGDPSAAKPRLEYPISVEANDCESLLVDWLNEVLYWFDGKQVAFSWFHVRDFHYDAIQAIGWGEPRDPERHRAKRIVKAVTYHQLKIELRSRWVAEVYLDI